MKNISGKSYLITEDGFSAFSGINYRRSKLHKGFNDIYKLYISHSFLIKDLVVSIDDMKYMEYEDPNYKIFKKFNK